MTPDAVKSRAVYQIRILRRLAYAAAAGIIAVCLLSLWRVVLPELAWQLWTADLIDQDLAFRLRYAQMPYGLGSVALLLAAVLFLVWLRRARLNVSVSAEAPRLLRPFWIGIMWVIPIANLFLPGLFVARVAEVSTAAPVQSPSRSGLLRLVWAWWVCWSVSYAFSWITSGTLKVYVDVPAIGWPVYVGMQVLYTVAGVLAIIMMFKIVSAQRALFTGLLPTPDSRDFPAFTVDDIALPPGA